MQIVPIINVADPQELKQRASIISEIFSHFPEDKKQVQIDAADGSFTSGYANWREPQDFTALEATKDFFVEVDALLFNPATELLRWLPADIKRFIFYLETAPNPDEVISLCRQNNIEPVLAITPKTSLKEASEHLTKVANCQLLAVDPGLSGQKFNLSTLDKIIGIRALFPEMSIEIDGGINDETARLCATSGADIIASSSFIFTDPSPIERYQDLRDIEA